MSRRVLAAAVALLASALTPLVLVPSAHADSVGAGLPIDAPLDLLAIPASGAVPAHLVAAGYTPGQDFRVSTGAVVTDATGDNAASVADLTHVTAVALAPDHSTVYAVSYDGTISSFDPSDPSTLSGSWPTGADACPYDAAVASDGKVWFTYGCDASSAGLAVLDPVSGAVTNRTPSSFPTTLMTRMTIANSLQRPDTLAVTDSGTDVALLIANGSAVSALGTIHEPYGVSATAFTPDGTEILVGANGGSLHRYTVATAPVLERQYDAVDNAETGIAVSPDGRFVATANPYQLYSFYSSTGTLLHIYSAGANRTALPRSVAWLGDTMVSATAPNSEGQGELELRESASLTPSHIAITGTSSSPIGHAIGLTGTLTDIDGDPLGGASITLTRHDGVRTTNLGQTTTGPLGRFVIHDAPPNGVVATYEAVYAGDAEHEPTTGSHAIAIARYSTYLSISTDAKYYRRAQIAHLTVHLGATYSARRVAVYATPAKEDQQLVALRAVDSHGYLHLNYPMYRNTTFVAKFFGDARHLPVAHSAYRATGVGLTLGLHNWYAQSGAYRVYHSTTYPKLVETVTPNKSGQCGYFYFETLKNGKWVELGLSQCFRLDYTSTAVAYFTGDRTAGRRYRVAAVWYKGDGVNTTTGSDWHYYRFTS